MAAGERYWEIDTLRGIAVVTMIAFHAVFDVWFFGILPVNPSEGFWRMLAYFTASTFIFLVGLSLTISHARAVQRFGGGMLYTRYLRRGLLLFCCGLAITGITWLFFRPGFIVFGILHFIGTSVLVAPFFLRFRTFNLMAGAAAILAGFALAGVEGPIWLLWLGLRPASFYSLDYIPLLPWFGLVLVGMYSGSLLYPEGRRRLSIRTEAPAFFGPLILLGRHSLAIYLIHQPVILLVLLALAPDNLLSFW
ncbi:hypothetical protein ASZ90_010382 [hydrocarbon metagenome]|uniref:Heparan-alpha-glucosaminide N-acetyltransferase catalytic domain-containing protein n=1 Tax=hydrocarbon metagenome TaxID=938273 RepID=A0A0W8FG71_9ZZZZ|nr:heparan-alpha-glucosaminide N-acetyltransferase [Methanomicrobiaceae archaeon]